MKTYRTNPVTQNPTADGSYIAFYATGIPTQAIYTQADGWNDKDIVEWLEETKPVHPQLVKWDEALRLNDGAPNLLIGLSKEVHVVLIPEAMTKIEAHDLLLDALHSVGEQLDAEELDEKQNDNS